MQLNRSQELRIELGNKTQSLILADFQIKMAMETENLQLDKELVEKAVEYFYSEGSEHSLGMYLVKMRGEKVIGCLLLTFENQHSWWIQSVYVVQEERRKGHFSSLFQEAVRLGAQKKVKSIRLYAENDNERAKSTYFKLGMSVIPEKMYSYDFVFGNLTIEGETNHYNIQKESQTLRPWVQGKINILTGEIYQENDWNNTFSFTKEGKVCSVMKLFTEFSDWRFGLAWYIREIYTEDQEKDNYQAMINELIKILLKVSTPKAATVRVLYKQDQKLNLKGGQLDHYDILEIKL